MARRGWLSPYLILANRVKLHSATITQGPIARWRGYATLQLGLAGGRLDYPGLPLNAAQTLRTAVIASASQTDFAHLPK